MHHRIVSPRLGALLIVGLTAALTFGCATPAKATSPTAQTTAPAVADAPAVQAAEDSASEALAAYRGASPACFAVLEKALALGGQGAYKSAFAALEAFDPANADPYALAFKTELLLEGHARSLLHRSFGLKDLGPGDDLEAMRRGEDPAAAALEMIAFDPPALAAALAAKGRAAPAVLEQAIGDYYYEVLRLFEGAWLLEDKELRERAAAAYGRAVAGGLASLPNSLRMAQIFIGLERFDDADRAFRAGIELSPYDGELRLNHASFLLMRELRSEAMAAIDAALAAFAAAAEVGAADAERRFEAYVLGVRAASELGEWGRVEGYLAAAEKAFPNEPAPGLLRHYAAVESGRVPEA
ncbi:MAG: hypothetical protein JNG85_16780, partial [Spirochaetaceae bacterium]|nr:hypothetical protein [Spirochaetaceae bacterium]